MTTLRNFADQTPDVPMAAAWYLADLAEGRGKQELFTRQSPQRLKALREHAMIESAVSSNRIEGVEIDPDRVRSIVIGKPAPRDRNEEEVRGYREALRSVHGSAKLLDISEETIRKLHRLSRGDDWDAGKYKARDVDIIQTYPDGRSRIRFNCVTAKKTPGAMANLEEQWNRVIEAERVHPLVAAAAFNLDFLCIHPFRDGNGRVSRLLLLLQCYRLGFEVGRYVSIERVIEQNKDRYYETLEQSSQSWHEGRHDAWPWINYVLFVLKTAYREFEERAGEHRAGKGEKTSLVLAAIQAQTDEFRMADIERACPGVSRDMVRRVLRDAAAAGVVECIGRGPGARWKRK